MSIIKNFKVLLGTIFFLLTFGTAHAAYVLTTTTETDGAVGFGSAGREIMAQSFTTTDAGFIESVQVGIERNSGTPEEELYFEIRAYDTNPDGTVLGTATLVTNGVMDETGGACDDSTTVIFDEPVEVEEATQYWFRMDRELVNDGDDYAICGKESDVYAGGQIKPYVDGAWSGLTRDWRLAFTIVDEGGGSGDPDPTTGLSDFIVTHDPSQTLFNGFMIFLASFSLVIFYFKKHV